MSMQLWAIRPGPGNQRSIIRCLDYLCTGRSIRGLGLLKRVHDGLNTLDTKAALRVAYVQLDRTSVSSQ